ncbi:hypothetical protein [Mucilaginibacter gossypii]|uniref:Uncharacterized protein n=1 Tax=Mucilaginibacter gossypii TaxID=551996 RepID=A0A1G8B8N4_9SPHI|nr:hypothetical protein [Mucilaginibacter gossypii]SDH29567.1 hypothetical protein SAMN05192573_108143 [Mucilaginibacter gossypii]
MATIDLHDVITDVLRNAGTPLRATEIVDIISRNGMYLTKDKNPPDYNQIYGRIGKYPHLFSWKDGVVTLRNLPREERLFRLTWNTKGWELPFKDLLEEVDDKDEPSCSQAEALRKQDLYINTALAVYGAERLWQLLSDGMIEHRGLFLNIKKFKTTPLKVA